MKGNGRIKLALISVVLIAAVIASVCLIRVNPSLLNLGLDLQGGISVALQAQPDEGKTITQDDMDNLITIMTKRIDEFGVAEPIIQQEGNDRLIIELAGVSDTAEATEMLGKTAKLEFIDPEGNVVLSGDDLVNATAGTNSMTGTGEVYLTFSDEGADKFAEVTGKFVGQELSIYLDGKEISSPTINQAITGGNAVIERVGTYEEAASLASLLRSGALPVSVEIIEMRVVGPQLGADSLQKSYVAILYGILAIFIFMIAYYRLPGVLTCVSLLLYALIIFWIQSLINVTLTLPGIAAFLLSTGMAVDANVIIFERIKDELRKGKTLSAAVSSGFQRAFRAILDSNVTTLIATVVLFYFGVSSVKGFAITLSLGVLSSMFTAIVFTRFLLNMAAHDKVLSKKSLYHS